MGGSVCICSHRPRRCPSIDIADESVVRACRLRLPPNKRMNPTPLSRRIAGGALRELLDESTKASSQAASRVMRDRWAAVQGRGKHISVITIVNQRRR
jgi:hypothetical protein